MMVGCGRGVWAVVVTAMAVMGCAQMGEAAEAPARSAGLQKAIDHYEARQQLFRQENETSMTVVLLGDSLTEGFDVAKHFPGRRVLNRGIGSDTIGVEPRDKDSRGVLYRLDTSVFDCGTSHVFLLIGINDMGDSRPVERMAEGYRKILETVRAQAPRVTVHVQSLLPTRGRFAHLNAPVREFNERLRAMAGELKCPFVDLHPLFCDANGELRPELTVEGLHLREAGYDIWQVAIEKELEGIGR